MQERVGELTRVRARRATRSSTTFVLLGMGGSSLAPEVLKRTFGVRALHVLDTTHPAMIRHAAESLDPRARRCSSSRVEIGHHARDAVALRRTSGSRPAGTESSSSRSPIPGSELEQVARRARHARLRRRADDRRSLLGAVAVRDRAGGADGHRSWSSCSRPRGRDGRGLPRARPARARARPAARRGLAARGATRSASPRPRAASGSGPSS